MPRTLLGQWMSSVVCRGGRGAFGVATAASLMLAAFVLSVPADAHHRPGHGGSPVFPPSTIADCGTVVQGVECLLFDADNSGLYVVSGLHGGGGIVLGGGEYQPGDRIFVEGDVESFCITYCQQGNGCIFNATISDCPTGAAMPDRFTTRDLLSMFDAWGPCQFAESCQWDLTGDGAIDRDDVLSLLTRFE